MWRKTYITLIRNNVDSFLSQHPDGLTVVCGDFNPTSTGITEQQTKNSTGLSQLIKILTRDTGTLERCLSNRPKLFAPPLQLPKLGTSDHFTVMIKPKTIPPNQIPPVNVISKRDSGLVGSLSLVAGLLSMTGPMSRKNLICLSLP